MSFFLTTDQVRQRTKDVTRRLGWSDAKPGERLQAIVKGQGIPKGGKVERICVIEVVSNKRERLRSIAKYPDSEVRREGFPDMTWRDFVYMFREHNGCTSNTCVQRIEFKYV